MMQARAIIQLLERRGLPIAAARKVIMAAIARGALREVQSASRFEDIKLVGEIPQSILLDEIRCRLPEGIVATAPIIISNIRPTLDVFQLIVAAAETELLIASPYIDGQGVKLLSVPLATACERNVRVRLLTRETERQQPARTAGIRHLAQLVGQGLDVRDYYARMNNRHAAAVHAKLLLADDAIGYVGSAEMRQHGLLSNFEMGYIFHHSSAIATARQAFMAFWEIASPVNVSDL
jgi:phosphatidylserine/phosphatidylglycerophosphate/cardiolipin synthase-like enzyme